MKHAQPERAAAPACTIAGRCCVTWTCVCFISLALFFAFTDKQNDTPHWNLRAYTYEIISRAHMANGLFAPDASGYYVGQYSRDFYYMINYAPSTVAELESVEGPVIRYAIEAMFAVQRSDGWLADAIIGEDTLCYNCLDSVPFYMLLLAAYADHHHADGSDVFCMYEPQIVRSLVMLNWSANGLIYNSPERPRCTYGFIDTVLVTGDVLFLSLLLYEGASRMAHYSAFSGCGNTTMYSEMQQSIAAGLALLYDPASGLFVSANVGNGFPDMWGSAYALSLNLTTVLKALLNLPGAWQNGQLRHLAPGNYWNTSLCAPIGCTPQGIYQNGGFWATPLSWTLCALADAGYKAVAASMVQAAALRFQQLDPAIGGLYEYTTTVPGGLGAKAYVATAASLLYASDCSDAAL